MTQGKRVALSAAQKSDMWRRWKAGQSLHEIGRAFGQPHVSIHLLLSYHGGIVPPVRRRSFLVLFHGQPNRNEIADHFFVLDGELTVETRAPDDYRTLAIGERYQINAGHAHQTSNRGTRDCRFLIVQGVGKYDFLRSPL